MTVSGGGAPMCLQRFAVALYKNLAAVGGECGVVKNTASRLSGSLLLLYLWVLGQSVEPFFASVSSAVQG